MLRPFSCFMEDLSNCSVQPEALAAEGVHPHKVWGEARPSAKQILLTGLVTVQNRMVLNSYEG